MWVDTARTSPFGSEGKHGMWCASARSQDFLGAHGLSARRCKSRCCGLPRGGEGDLDGARIILGPQGRFWPSFMEHESLESDGTNIPKSDGSLWKACQPNKGSFCQVS